ncbi:hypothetical protein AK830_g10456 [Neonectria ditissima]|uniref:Amidoligase enzyme n=1 Tax=Neonectria ditissima TaxID=78410 RepID=A0A0P7B721_9HYPO|nr:hypothetical protein AK830_g10456 [Neonectria ditissima]
MSCKTKDVGSNDDGESRHGANTPMCPPQISFGVELEFFVAESPLGIDPDLSIADQLPPLFVGKDEDSVYNAISELLCKYQIEAYVPSHEAEEQDNKAKWTVTHDTSLESYDEQDSGYNWKGVEIKSPASYACDEAFNLIKVVVRLITTRFRTRVNTSCGFHVHLGNGPYRLDMQTARNFAALTWAAEPKLSVLHCPSRTIAQFSQSIRRVRTCELSQGMGAHDAYKATVTTSGSAHRWMARYQGRARKIGEPPIASIHDMYRHMVNQEQDEDNYWLEPECEDDDSDILRDAKPFSRPKKIPGQRVKSVKLLGELDMYAQIPSDDAIRKMGNNKMSGALPQIDFPMPEAVQAVLRDDEANRPSQAPATSRLERPREPIRNRDDDMRAKQMSLDEMYKSENIRNRTNLAGWTWSEETPTGDDLAEAIDHRRPVRTGTWSGAAELFACDIGTHQVAYLMGGAKNLGDNWEGQQIWHLAVLPTMMSGTGNPYMTVESRGAGGSLDAEWIATWARIQCRLMAFARDAEPAEFMRVIGLLGEDDGRAEARYDVVDLLEDIGCYAEARVCEDRVKRGDEAYFESMMLSKARPKPKEEEFENDKKDPLVFY